MLGYGHDESVPYAWRSVSRGISWVYVVICGVFVRHFVGGVGVLWNVRNGFWVLERVGLLYKVHLELA